MDIPEPALLACVGQIYQAANDSEAWPLAVEAVRHLLNGARACLVRIGPDRRPDDLVAPSNDPAFQDRYIAEFADTPNIIEEAVARAPVGIAYHDLAFIGRDVLRGSRLWNDWMAPQDMYGGLSCKLATDGPSSWFIDVQRGRRHPGFDGHDLQLMQTLAPHLARALQIARRTALAQLVSPRLANLPCAMLAVDPRLHVLARNVAADEMLADGVGGLALAGGALVTTDPRHAARLRRLVADACADRPDAVPGRGGDLLISDGPVDTSTTLMISVGPAAASGVPVLALEPCAAVIIRRLSPQLPAHAADTIAGLFDLTPQEARVAVALAAGHSLKTIAEQGGIRLTTVRTHLARIFSKTGARQQSQLVAILRSVQGTSLRG
jgi:DNA-binding CsgD family transcriptional regulator